ncbi:MAG: hypothetical protein NC203_09450 [Firmicutes bacterium]|nr:hypothetical protein [[Eubacterium] siraeum]MCM1488579.1 hypothetical protein [Bacillota bacterium]
MSQFSMFMRQNKKPKENAFYAATASLCDEKGSPLIWELRQITSKENEELRDSCVAERTEGRSTVQRLKTAEYIAKVIAASVVKPDLYNAELQDSYGVKTPVELLYALVDDPGEYGRLAAFVQRLQGFETLEEKAEQAKN